jgi:ElaB/YqjD/DUF883 family membrane-anchored ribosome-binding protein
MTTEQTNDRLVTDLKRSIGHAEEVLGAAGGEAGEKASDLKNRLAALIESAKATCERLEEKTVAAAKATDRTIRQHPYESIGVAFGLGLLIGVLLTRK